VHPKKLTGECRWKVVTFNYILLLKMRMLLKVSNVQPHSPVKYLGLCRPTLRKNVKSVKHTGLVIINFWPWISLCDLLHTGGVDFNADDLAVGHNIYDKRFTIALNLRRHDQLVHTVARPFSCQVCNKLFNRKAHPHRQQVLHTGNRRFSSQICDKTFTETWNLHKHEL